MATRWNDGFPRKYGFAEPARPLPNQYIPPVSIGLSCPQHCPQHGHAESSPLGAPLTIREVARLIGCSPWTVRQKHVPRGLPCLRSGANAKLIFYREQVIAWILAQQQKGGTKL